MQREVTNRAGTENILTNSRGNDTVKPCWGGDWGGGLLAQRLIQEKEEVKLHAGETRGRVEVERDPVIRLKRIYNF
jgi:hypothetical protein